MLFRDLIALHCFNQQEHTHTVNWQPTDINNTTHYVVTCVL